MFGKLRNSLIIRSSFEFVYGVKFRAFQIRKEGDFVRFRGKIYVFDLEWVPSSGIQLIKDETEYEPLRPSKLRTESLRLDTVFCHLETKLYPILDMSERVEIKSNWDCLRDKLEGVERACLPSLKIEDLPKQSATLERQTRDLPESLNVLIEEEAIPELEGLAYPEEALEGSRGSGLIVGQIVAIWTLEKNRCDLLSLGSSVYILFFQALDG